MKQKTLKSSFTISGKGLHTGLEITATFLPAPENTGYKIQRIDLPDQPIIDAVAENVVDTMRGTVVAKGDARVSTIEHALAALYCADIDNCLIQVDAPEFPILDGSAIYFAEAIEQVGVEEQMAEKDYFIIKSKIEVTDEKTGSSIIVLPDDEFSINTMIAYDSPILNNQFAALEHLSDFKQEIAACRTFVFVREVEPLLKCGLIKGGDLDNAIVIYDRVMDQADLDRLITPLQVNPKPANELGYLNNKPLVFENEPARHKLLDILGDIALVGRPIRGRIIATRPGHTINNKFARFLRKEIFRQDLQAPIYDPNKVPLMDTNKIRSLLPHRYPFLLVDKVIELGEKHVVGVKNVSGNEPFFEGHFPQEPVMPGVLIIEAMAQTGGLLVLNKVEEPERYSTYFMKIDNVKFRQKVVPGDTLIFHLSMLTEIRRGCAYMKGYAFVGEKIVAEAEFMAQITKNK